MIGAVENLPQALAECLLAWLAMGVYLWYFRDAERFFARMAALLAATLAAGILVLRIDAEHFEIILAVLLFWIYLPLGAWCAQIGKNITCYLTVWALMTYLACRELWTVVAIKALVGFPLGTKYGFLCMAATLLIYAALFLTLRYWMNVYKSMHMGPRQLTSAILLFVIYLVQQFNVYHNLKFDDRDIAGVMYVMLQTYCFAVIYLQSTLFYKSQLQHELETTNLLWKQKKEQYELSKETITLINRKCHDLKHQIAAMRTMDNSEQREKYIREIESSVNIYDANVHTGNDTLDTVLTEKTLLCEANGITIHCVADGRSLGFMDAVDLYTIMGNALDNAMEAVGQIAEKEKRLIDVLIHARQKFLVMNITNPVNGELQFKDGLPVSTKPKTGYHGFGVSSIRQTVRKYGGEMTVSAENGCFSLRILIPLN